MQTHKTYSTSEIQGITAKIRHRTTHRSNMLKPIEYDFLMSMDYVLREQKRTTVSIKQHNWLDAILCRTQQAKAH